MMQFTKKAKNLLIYVVLQLTTKSHLPERCTAGEILHHPPLHTAGDAEASARPSSDTNFLQP